MDAGPGGEDVAGKAGAEPSLPDWTERLVLVFIGPKLVFGVFPRRRMTVSSSGEQ